MIIFLILSIFGVYNLGYPAPSVGFHEFHLSKCEIEYNTDEKSLEISIQMFIDDFELALESLGHIDLKLSTIHEDSLADVYILDYLTKHLTISVDDSYSLPTWIGKEPSDDLAGIWCYLIIENVSPKQKMSVSNNVLMEIFEDQRNIVKVKVNQNSKAYFLFETGDSTGELIITP